MTSKTQIAAELAACLMLEASRRLDPPDYVDPSPAAVAANAMALLRIGAGVKRWAERACNGEGHQEWRKGLSAHGGRWEWAWNDSDTAAHEKADKRAHAKASEIAARYGATVEIGGDPRGFVLRLHLASGRKNGMGDGWGVA